MGLLIAAALLLCDCNILLGPLDDSEIADDLPNDSESTDSGTLDTSKYVDVEILAVDFDWSNSIWENVDFTVKNTGHLSIDELSIHYVAYCDEGTFEHVATFPSLFDMDSPLPPGGTRHAWTSLATLTGGTSRIQVNQVGVVYGTKSKTLEISLVFDALRPADPLISLDRETAPATVTLSCATPHSSIYYTVDDSEPSEYGFYSELYETPFVIYENTVVRAVAAKEDHRDSGVVTKLCEVIPVTLSVGDSYDFSGIAITVLGVTWVQYLSPSSYRPQLSNAIGIELEITNSRPHSVDYNDYTEWGAIVDDSGAQINVDRYYSDINVAEFSGSTVLAGATIADAITFEEYSGAPMAFTFKGRPPIGDCHYFEIVFDLEDFVPEINPFVGTWTAKPSTTEIIMTFRVDMTATQTNIDSDEIFTTDGVYSYTSTYLMREWEGGSPRFLRYTFIDTETLSLTQEDISFTVTYTREE